MTTRPKGLGGLAARLRWPDAAKRVSPERSLILMGFGAVVGLLIAGFGLFTAKGTSISGVPPEAIATVNDHPILLSDYFAQLSTDAGVNYSHATRQQRLKVLRDMINEELMVQRGLEIDLPSSDPDVRAALVAGALLRVDANVLAAPPTEAQLRQYFDTHKSQYGTNGVMTGIDLVASPEPGKDPQDALKRAVAAADALRTGEPASEVIRQFRLTQTGALNEDTYDLNARMKLGPALYSAVAALRPTEVSAPVVRDGVVHVVQILTRILPQTPRFEDAMKAVYADYQRSAREPVEAANYRYLRERARILVAPEYTR